MNIIAAAVLVVLSTATAAAAAGDPSWVPVGIDRAGAVIVHVHVNDNGPFPFLLDTGATHSVISDSLADRLKLQHVAAATVATSTGREQRAVVRLNQTAIGTARSSDILATVAPAPRLASIARGIDGIIGQDFLFSFNYTLDYRRRRLVWSTGDTVDDGTRIPLVAQRGRYLAQISVRGNDTPMLLVPDSGANGFVMFTRDGRTRMALDATAGGTSILSLSGRQDVRTMTVPELLIGDVVLRNQPVAVIARDGVDAQEGDGLLPLHLFASVSFNAREQCLVVRYAE